MLESNLLRVMTYNMRYAHETPPHSWNERKELIKEVVLREAPDLIGTQECLFQQVKDLTLLLPDHDWVGLGREGGSQGEYMAVFFKKDRLEVLEYGHFWLSDTPAEIGSRTWGNICPRMVTWIRFQDLRSETTFYHLNTHLDNYSSEARIKGAKLIVQQVRELSPAEPIVLTGDFNEGNGSEPYQLLTAEGAFTDTWYAATERGNEELGTFNDFTDKTGGNDRIDWILVHGDITVEATKIIGDCPEESFPSDHFPIIADLKI
ncbi:endonuclease/exonuclease/phosphatase family protein [Neobacillus vireti]|uniref:endonuclease/exonuclease/phosphatase family protein n=1 Tax=Neobacillus vireti TaxID=220686 RepID=UPI002FFEA68E